MSTRGNINPSAIQGPLQATNPLTGSHITIDPPSTTILSIPDAKASRHLFLVDREDAASIYLLDSMTAPQEPLYTIPKGFKRNAARNLAIGKVTNDRKGAKCIYTVTKTPPVITPLSITIDHRDADAKPYATGALLTKRVLRRGLNLSFSTSASSRRWKVDERGIQAENGQFMAKEIRSSENSAFQGACELQLTTTIDDDEMDFLVAVWVARVGNETGALEGEVDITGGDMFVKGEMMLFNYK